MDTVILSFMPWYWLLLPLAITFAALLFTAEKVRGGSDTNAHLFTYAAMVSIALSAFWILFTLKFFGVSV